MFAELPVTATAAVVPAAVAAAAAPSQPFELGASCTAGSPGGAGDSLPAGYWTPGGNRAPPPCVPCAPWIVPPPMVASPDCGLWVAVAAVLLDLPVRVPVLVLQVVAAAALLLLRPTVAPEELDRPCVAAAAAAAAALLTPFLRCAGGGVVSSCAANCCCSCSERLLRLLALWGASATLDMPPLPLPDLWPLEVPFEVPLVAPAEMLRDKETDEAPAVSPRGSRESLQCGGLLGCDDEEAGIDREVSRSGGTARLLSCSWIQCRHFLMHCSTSRSALQNSSLLCATKAVNLGYTSGWAEVYTED